MKKLLAVLEIGCAVTALIFAVAWVRTPTAPIEPYVALFSLLGVFLSDYARRRGQYGSIGARIPAIFTRAMSASGPTEAVPQQQAELPYLEPSESTVLFSDRFSDAFPGVREIQWFEGKKAIERLLILLREPLKFQYDRGETFPIWWWRNGNMYIQRFSRLRKNTVLMNRQELNIRRIAAVPSESYYRSFVYVEVEAMEPVDSRTWTEAQIGEGIEERGYCSEEYGLYKGKQVVTREEYDDDAAMIRGKVVQMDGQCEARERFLSPYNFLIAPHGNPLNTNQFDRVLRGHLNGLLEGAFTVEELRNEIKLLPRKER